MSPPPPKPHPPPPAALSSASPLISTEAFEATLANLALAFPDQTVLVATPDNVPQLSSGGPLHLTPLHSCRTLRHPLGPHRGRLPQHLQACAGEQSLHLSPPRRRVPVTSSPKPSAHSPQPLSPPTSVVAHYNLGPREGLVNSAILYPVTRALFSASPRFPLAIDLSLSLRMAERLASSAQRFTATNQNDALIWPVSEAAVAGYSIAEVGVRSPYLRSPSRRPQHPPHPDRRLSLHRHRRQSRLLAAHPHPPAPPADTVPRQATDGPADVAPMLDAFHLAYTNLHEIWSLVLPPNSLLGLKRLSVMPPESFRMPDTLWARIVYDFVLAYRLRTINRGHLLGALTPLYLAWVASHLILVNSGIAPEAHIEELAAAFETDKPYLVSRWRWPDRFNP